MNISKRWLLVPSFLFIIFTASQTTRLSYSELKAELQRAQIIYNNATNYGPAENYDEEKEAFFNRKALSAFQFLQSQIPDEFPYDTLGYWCNFRLGELHHFFEEYDDALKGYKSAIQRIFRGNLEDSLLFKPLLYSGILFYNKAMFDSSSYYFRRAEQILITYDYKLDEKERLFNTLGVLHYEQGDYRQAGNYFEKALQTLSPSHPYFLQLQVNYKINIAQLSFKMEDYESANRIYGQIIKEHGTSPEILHNLGLIHFYLGAQKKALDYLKKVDYTNNRSIWLYANVGEIFLGLNQIDSSLHYLHKAISRHKELGKNSDPTAHGKTLMVLGDLYRKTGNFSEALNYYQQSLHHFYPSFSDTSVTSNPLKFGGVFSYIHFFQAMAAKAETFHDLFEKDNNLRWAEAELKTYESIFQLLQYVEFTYESDEARLFLDKSKYIIHSKPIDIAYTLLSVTKDNKYLERLYQLDQYNKASILAIRTRANQNVNLPSNPSSQIKAEISRLSIKALRMADSTQLNGLNSKIRDLEIELDKLHAGDNNVNPKNLPTIKELQQSILNQGSALLSFHLSPTELTRIFITRDRAECIQKPLTGHFFKDLEKIISDLKNPRAEVKTKDIYLHLFEGLDLKEIKRLIIIPDDELNYLSFESLQNEEGKFLVQKFAIQYQYTTALLKKEKVKFKDHKTVSFAPFDLQSYRDSSLFLSSLPNTRNEISEIKGKQLFGHQASKENFLNNLDYPVIHLATHAIVNYEKDNISFIAFSPGEHQDSFLLYAEEIFHLPLQKTKLILLSACETGTGKLVKGEGIMSLSRAFTYAGCPNIVTSLWVANDFSTAYITRRLHHYLNQNMPVDVALHKAKIDYLNDPAVNPGMKHPHYWSHLVFIGNYGEPAGVSSWWFLAGFLMLAVLIIGIIKFRKKRNPGIS